MTSISGVIAYMRYGAGPKDEDLLTWVQDRSYTENHYWWPHDRLREFMKNA